jgi:hypothetical protein
MFKFRLNDKVTFKEYDGHIYRIVGYRLERSFYPYEEWTTIIYELYREFDGLAIDAEEDDLVMMKKREESMISSIVILKSLRESRSPQGEKNIDALLDEYNDYKRLAAFFQDVSYELKMYNIIEKLRNI